MMEELRFSEKFLQEPYGVTSQKTAFFTVTAVKTSDVTYAFSVPVIISKELT
jgi:hypothetical protein